MSGRYLGRISDGGLSKWTWFSFMSGMNQLVKHVMASQAGKLALALIHK
jgi:hypothetical protein